MREETFAKWLAPNSVTVVITQQTIRKNFRYGAQTFGTIDIFYNMANRYRMDNYTKTCMLLILNQNSVHLKHILNYKLVYIQ